MASDIAIPNRFGLTEIYIGGAGDTRTRLVASYVDARKASLGANPSRAPYYFPHYAPYRIVHLARRHLSQNRPLALIGHSWGGDTALRVLQTLRPYNVDLLVCVDPVSKSRLNPPPVPRNVSQLVHVDARPQLPNQSDKVKRFGEWIGGALHHRLSSADSRIVTDSNHFAFAAMMQAIGPNGLSAADHIERLCDLSQSRVASSSSASSGQAT